MRRDARAQQARWGCPAAGLAPPAALDPDLAYEAAEVARITGTPPADTCPFACVERADPWVAELTRAVALREWVPDLTDTLGRPLCAADLDALDTLRRAQSEAIASDRAIAEEARKSQTPPPGR
ncbi:MAG: hypothetical protein JWM10_3012 [Myxococcaceae bacterium]|nr:hypothetical protein [Myxococcaceae bacterium]